MSDINPVEFSSPGPANTILENVRKQLGVVPNIYATMAHSTSVLEGFLAFSGALGAGVLDASIREQIALTVAGENACDYCASAHTVMAAGAGVDKEEAAKNLRGDATDPRTKAILSFAQSVVVNRGNTTTDELNLLRGHDVSDAEVVEIIANVGINLFTNYFNHIAGTKIDFPLVEAQAKS